MEEPNAEREFQERQLEAINSGAIEEKIEYETDEWSSVIEKAQTPKERRDIIKTILIIAGLEATNDQMEKELRVAIDLNSDESRKLAEETLKKGHAYVNKARQALSLPPKYTESE